MTPVQQEVIDRVKARLAPIEERYKLWSYAVRFLDRLDLENLRELVRVMNRLTDDDWRELARKAQALADWNHPHASSADAALAKQSSQAAEG